MKEMKLSYNSKEELDAYERIHRDTESLVDKKQEQSPPIGAHPLAKRH